MYNANHKLSPPTLSAISPRTTMSNLDTGYSSTHQRNGTRSGDSDPDRPTSPLEQYAQPNSGNSNSSAAAAAKKTRLVYQPESPKGSKRRGKGLLALLEGRQAQYLFLASLFVNLLLLAVVLTSFGRSLPACLSSATPLSTSQPLGVESMQQAHKQILGLHNLDTGNTNINAASEVVPESPVVTAPNTDSVPAQPVDTPTSPAVLPIVASTIPTPVAAEKLPAASTEQPLSAHAAAAPVAAAAVAAVTPASAEPISAVDRPFADDLSEREYNAEAHSVTWQYCLAPADQLRSFTQHELANLSSSPDFASFPSLHCPVKPTVEQSWQIGWYGGQVAVNVKESSFPLPQKCVQLPPDDYVWPKKYTDLPAADQSFLHWPNLRVAAYEELVVFNQGTPKNLYHFNAPRYDLDGLDELSLGARHIPFQRKVRNFLDIGAGGGSLGLLLKRKFGVEAMSIIFPDWPYCEYITERGGLCVLVDVMAAMPFARASFDAVHISWVYHGQQPAELVQMYTEVDRIVRPGGYVWQRGGWSLSQIAAQKQLFDRLGYVQLYEKLDLKPKGITESISFGPDLPFEAEWACIYVKPIRAERKADCDTAPVLMTVAQPST